MSFDAGGVELKGFETGTGPAVLLVHGWAEDSSAMGPLVGPLRAAGFRVVAVDLPAHGGSRGTTTNIYDSARALNSVASSLGEVFAVVAHSLGGAITVAALREDPWTRRAVLIASPVRLHGAVDRFSTMLRLPPKAVLGLERAIERRFGRGVWSDLAADSVAPRLGIEALIVHDRDDDQVPWTEAKMLADSWPGAGLLLTGGLGHGKVLRDEEVISAIVGFLSEDRTTGSPEADRKEDSPGAPYPQPALRKSQRPSVTSTPRESSSEWSSIASG